MRVFFVILWLFTIGAGATLRLGLYYTEDYNRFCVAYDTTPPLGDSWEGVITYRASYRGFGIEGEYGPVWLFRCRLSIAEMQFFHRAKGQNDPTSIGGFAVALFPSLGADISLEPPFRWRLLPYVWGGLNATVYGGKPELHDFRFLFGPEIHARAGIGVRYQLTRTVDISTETQWYAHNTYRKLEPGNIEDAGGQYIVQSIALNRIQIGIRVKPPLPQAGSN
ncbi:MAG: hypothetical protein ACP5JB_08100 [candidate division WOR-3 bacterium]